MMCIMYYLSPIADPHNLIIIYRVLSVAIIILQALGFYSWIVNSLGLYTK